MTNQNPKRRWYQYSLRTLFVFMVLVAVVCSWFAVKMQRVRRQREAVKAIVEAGGSVVAMQIRYYYDHESDCFRFRSLPKRPTPTWMRKLLGDDFLATAEWVHVRNDDGLEHLNGLTNLKWLELVEHRWPSPGIVDTRKGVYGTTIS